MKLVGQIHDSVAVTAGIKLGQSTFDFGVSYVVFKESIIVFNIALGI